MDQEKRITGIMVYYYFVCPKKLWYFSHDIQLESDNELVIMGRIIDEYTFKRNDKHIEIDGVISIDFIKSTKVLHEVKKSKAIEVASIWQLKYYLYYLRQRGVTGVTGIINYPLRKEKITVELSAEDIQTLDEACQEIQTIIEQVAPPELVVKKICKKCAYYDLCYL